MVDGRIIPGLRRARRSKLVGTLTRYLIAAIGPVGSSAAQFVLSFAMLRVLSPGDFGSFTFLLVAAQLCSGIWVALFCAPLPTFLSSGRPDEQAQGEATIMAASLAGVVVALPIFAAMGGALKLGPLEIACFAAFAALNLVRQLARAHAYLHLRLLRVMFSDITYSGTVLAMLATALLVMHWPPRVSGYAALLVAAILALLPFGSAFARSQCAPFGWSDLSRYRAIWRGQSRWALLGVVSTEATANAHVYLITLFQGPTAFAPIAAGALLARPVNVAQNAVADFEKPQMARLIGKGDAAGLLSAKRFFLGTLVAVWLLACIAAFAIFSVNPRLVFSKSYDLGFLQVATALWLLVAAIRMLQVPPATVLTAAGSFRSLAIASIWSSLASLAVTAILLATVGALWSILGIAVGALLFVGWTHRAYLSWYRDFASRGG